MSEETNEERPEEGGMEAGPVSPSPEPAQPQRRSRRATPWFAALLIVVIVGAASSPFWAPELAPLLPWGGPDTSAERYTALTARVAALEQRPIPPKVDLEPVKSALGGLASRLDQVDARLTEIVKHPAPPAADAGAVQSAVSALSQRVGQLEAAGADHKLADAVTAAQAELRRLDERVADIEAQSAQRRADAQTAQQELARLDKAGAEIGDRLATLEREIRSQSAGEMRNDAMLALLLAQMREAAEQARPFQAEYNAFAKLARDPELTAAAEPLAEAARNGVPGRTALAKRLSELAGKIAAPSEPVADAGWGSQALARLRGLVTIRRIDGSPQSGPEAAVAAAQAALARGDLAGAASVLAPLSGASAGAARPWLQMARERLAVEAALDHVQELLTVRVGSSPAAAPTRPSDESPEKTRTRS